MFSSAVNTILTTTYEMILLFLPELDDGVSFRLCLSFLLFLLEAFTSVEGQPKILAFGPRLLFFPSLAMLMHILM